MNRLSILGRNIRHYERLRADPLTPAETQRILNILLARARKELRDLAEDERNLDAGRPRQIRRHVGHHPSPCLLRETRPLWRACRDRLGWSTFRGAPCATCALASPCMRQRAMAQAAGRA